MKLKYLLMLFAFTLIFTNQIRAQFYGGSKYSGIGLPFFELEVFRTFSMNDATPQIHVYLEILNDDLTFIKSDSTESYNAKFELIAAVYDQNENQVLARVATNDVFVKEYELTNSRDERIQLSRSLDLPEGTYNLKLRITDLISKKTLSRNIEFNLENKVEEELAVSDLLFLNDLELDETGAIIMVKPHVRTNFSRNAQNFYLYFNAYIKKVPAELQIRYQFIDSKGETELDTTVITNAKKPVTSHIFKVDQNLLTQNNYRCNVTVETEDDEIEKVKGLSFYWVSIPETEKDIDMALRQMRYIAPVDSLDKYEDAPPEEQKKYFESYWNSVDPNPSTEINELMEEYFQRVNYANREFSNFNEGGWLSDRGRILIKFGPPDDIERHPFELNSVPYEVWRYYSLRKIFVFSDRTGFGDYRLLPEYMEQEYH